MSESDETRNTDDHRPAAETPAEPVASWPQYTWPPLAADQPEPTVPNAPTAPAPTADEPAPDAAWASWPPTQPQPAAAATPPGPYATAPNSAAPNPAAPYAADPYATAPNAGDPYVTAPYPSGPYAANPNPGPSGPSESWGAGPWAPPPPAWGAPGRPAAWPPIPPAPAAPTKARRGLAALAALALVFASAGVGAGVAIAVHNNSNTRTFDSAGTNSLGNNPPTGNGGTGVTLPGGGNGSVPSGGGTLDMSAIAAKVDPALVNIDTTLAQGRAAGTGMLISSTGEILTNNHVIADAKTIKVVIGGTGPSHDAKVVGYDVTEDVALLQITDNVSNLPTITFGDPKQAQVGDPVVAIGNAGGKGGTPSVSQGQITLLDQQVTAGDQGGNQETLQGMIQISAPIQPGDSGGALVDETGKILGMNTAAAGGGRFNSAGSDIGFAIPIDNAVGIVGQIRTGVETDKVHIGDRALLGVQVVDLAGQSAPVTAGALVKQVQDHTGASAAGMQIGDVLVSIDGKAVTDSASLRAVLAKLHPGDSVRVGWVDSTGQKHEASVKLVVGPPL
jgi:S1-C subfamily serine protease